MKENRIPYDTDKFDEEIISERESLKSCISFEELQEIEYSITSNHFRECTYCGGEVSKDGKYLYCDACGIRIEKL